MSRKVLEEMAVGTHLKAHSFCNHYSSVILFTREKLELSYIRSERRHLVSQSTDVWESAHTVSEEWLTGKWIIEASVDFVSHCQGYKERKWFGPMFYRKQIP